MPEPASLIFEIWSQSMTLGPLSYWDPLPGHCVMLFGNETFIVSLSTQRYKWVLANCQGSLMECWREWVNLEWITIPFRGITHTSGYFMLLNCDEIQLDGPLLLDKKFNLSLPWAAEKEFIITVTIDCQAQGDEKN